MKDVRRNTTCLLDLSDGIFLKICRYLPPSHVLYSFYTLSRSDFRLHRIISDYYKNIKLDRITNNQYIYFSSSINYLALDSLILSNEHVQWRIQKISEGVAVYPRNW
jgi:hypothetical protein